MCHSGQSKYPKNGALEVILKVSSLIKKPGASRGGREQGTN
jgi:hypothetical protein